MASARKPAAPKDTVQDIPLPGLLEVVTVQANITIHRKQGFIKWVVVVREPVEQTELHRKHGASYEIPTGVAGAKADTLESIGQALYMAGFDAGSRPTN